MEKFKRSSRVGVRSVRIADKIEAKKKLVKELGGDWDSMTQKQLDDFWDTNCSQYVLTNVPGKGLKYVPFDSIKTKGGIQ